MVETTPIYIGKLVFEDYHSFKGRNELDLMDKDGHLFQWTVFLGNNNTGKTSLLKAIADLEPFLQFDSVEARQLYAPIDLHLSKLKDERLTNKHIHDFVGINVCIEYEKTNKHICKKEVEKLMNFNGNDFNFGFSPNNEWTLFENENMKFLKIYSYGVTRKIGNNGISEKSEELNSESLFNPEHKLTNIEEWLFQLKFASQNGKSAAGERLELLKAIITSEILPEISDFRFITTETLKNYIEYQTKEGWFLFEQLGYGYQATMAWIIDLCKKLFERYPASPNPLKEPAIVLVDELDLHLHPKWQKTIVDYLSKTFPMTQFIVTTHSPLILQSMQKVNLFALIKAEDRVNIRHIPMETLEGWSVEEILRDVMDMEDGVYSDRYYSLYKEFDRALDADDYEQAKLAFDQLMEILHPTSLERKILKLQLSQITPVNDKA